MDKVEDHLQLQNRHAGAVIQTAFNVIESDTSSTCDSKASANNSAEADKQVQEGALFGLHNNIDRGQIIHEPYRGQAHVTPLALGPILRH